MYMLIYIIDGNWCITNGTDSDLVWNRIEVAWSKGILSSDRVYDLKADDKNHNDTQYIRYVCFGFKHASNAKYDQKQNKI